MAQAVTVALELGADEVFAFSRIGPSAGPQVRFEAPARPAQAAHYCESGEFHDQVLGVLTVMHFPVIDTLLFALPTDAVERCRARLEQSCTGRHVVANTECRSQTLTVLVRRVVVVPQPAAVALAASNHSHAA